MKSLARFLLLVCSILIATPFIIVGFIFDIAVLGFNCGREIACDMPSKKEIKP